MTNNSWIIRPAFIKEKLNVDHYTLLNDFAAIAHSVDVVDAAHLRHLCGPDKSLKRNGVISVIGPGTGLGVAALLYDRMGNVHILPTEGGHSDFSPLDGVDQRILENLRRHHSRVSVERIVSGPGMRAIFETLSAMQNTPMPQGNDRELWQKAITGDDTLSSTALDRFCMALGSIAGDIALTHGPGSVVIAGGLGLRLADYLPKSGFAERFAAKGRYQSLMESLAVKIITHEEPGLLGAAAAFAKEHCL